MKADIGKTVNVSFQNLVVDGNRKQVDWRNIKGDGSGHGISFWGVHGGKIQDVTIQNCWTDGIYVSGTRKATPFINSKNIEVKNIEISNCGRQGISIISLEKWAF